MDDYFHPIYEVAWVLYIWQHQCDQNIEVTDSESKDLKSTGVFRRHVTTTFR